MRIRGLSLALVFVGSVDCRPQVTGGAPEPGCGSGSAQAPDGSCLKRCDELHGCARGFACLDDFCVQLHAPVIEVVEGDAEDGSIQRALRVVGQNLEYASARLEAEGTEARELTIVAATDSSLMLALPEGLLARAYTLRVVNAAGDDTEDVTLIRGPPGQGGAPGVCNAEACTSAVLPGAAHVTYLRLRSRVQGEPADAAIWRNGLIESSGFEAGLVFVTLDATTQEVAANGPRGLYSTSTAAQRSSLGFELDALLDRPQAYLLGVASSGDVADDLRAGSEGTRLADILAAFGAGGRLLGLEPNEGFVMVGRKGMVPGRARLVVGSETAVDDGFIVADGVVIGGGAGGTPATQVCPAGVMVGTDGRGGLLCEDRYGDLGMQEILGEDIFDGTIKSEDIFDGTIKSEDIFDGTIKSEDMGPLSVGLGSIVFDAVGSEQLAEDSIYSAHIREGEVYSSDIHDGEVGNADLADRAVSGSKLSSNLFVTSRLFIRSDVDPPGGVSVYTPDAKKGTSAGCNDSSQRGRMGVFTLTGEDWLCVCLLEGSSVRWSCIH